MSALALPPGVPSREPPLPQRRELPAGPRPATEQRAARGAAARRRRQGQKGAGLHTCGRANTRGPRPLKTRPRAATPPAPGLAHMQATCKGMLPERAHIPHTRGMGSRADLQPPRSPHGARPRASHRASPTAPHACAPPRGAPVRAWSPPRAPDAAPGAPTIARGAHLVVLRQAPQVGLLHREQVVHRGGSDARHRQASRRRVASRMAP